MFKIEVEEWKVDERTQFTAPFTSEFKSFEVDDEDAGHGP